MNTNGLRFGLAQMRPQEDLGRNLESHVRFIEAAAKEGLACIAFPELSLTGYTTQPDQTQILPWDDPLLSRLALCCQTHNVYALVGLPLRIADALFIGQYVFTPSGNRVVYGKKHLHGEEPKSYAAGAFHNVVAVEGVLVGMAVCADFAHADHAAEAVRGGAELYLAGALVSESGYKTDCRLLAQRARSHGFPVALANYVGTTGGWTAVGGSTLWDTDGRVVLQAPFAEECLVVCSYSNSCLSGNIVCCDAV